ncbi:hypothetical protein ACYPKM_02190 [Pseudomonas aeruginosa]
MTNVSYSVENKIAACAAVAALIADCQAADGEISEAFEKGFAFYEVGRHGAEDLVYQVDLYQYAGRQEEQYVYIKLSVVATEESRKAQATLEIRQRGEEEGDNEKALIWMNEGKEAALGHLKDIAIAWDFDNTLAEEIGEHFINVIFPLLEARGAVLQLN